MKVRQMANNQYIIDVGNLVIFQSYTTMIACYDSGSGKLYLDPYWEYSKTTMKYFKRFLEEETRIEYGTKKDFEKRLMEDDIIMKEILEFYINSRINII